jgi:hypothetical protein
LAGAETRGLAKKSKTPFVILGIALFFLFIVVPAVAFLVYQAVRRDSPPAPVDFTIKGENQVQPPAPAVPGHPEVPPPPPGHPAPPEGASGGVTGPLASLIYPGSHQVMNVEGENGAKVIKLTTSDPADKVADWYAAKLPHSNRVSVPFVGITTISKNGLAVIIRPGNPTNIMLTKGDE